MGTSRGKVMVASFRGKNNCAKAKVLITLYLRRQQGIKRGMTFMEVTRASKIPYGSFHPSRWHRWNYINRRLSLEGGKPCYLYTIALRGIHFVEDRIPPNRYEDYLNEMK